MLMLYRFLILSILIIIPLELLCQWRNYFFKELGAQDGLTTNIYCFSEDSIGNIYLGTGQGLVRYDGTDFQNFIHNPEDSTTIGAGEVYSMLYDSNNNLWAGLRFGGVNRYSPKTGKFKRYDIPTNPLRPIRTVSSIYEDSEKNIWAGGSKFRLYYLNKETDQFEFYTPKWHDQTKIERRYDIIRVLEDKSDPNILWLSVLDYRDPNHPELEPYGIVKFDKRTKSFESQPCTGEIDYQDEDGNLWGGTWYSGVYQYNPATEDCNAHLIKVMYANRYHSHTVYTMYKEDDFAWVGMRGAIAKLFSDGNYQVVLNKDEIQSVTSIHKDGNKNVWFGRENGISRIDVKNQHIDFYSLTKHDFSLRLYPVFLVYDEKSDAIVFTHNYTKIFKLPLDKSKEISIFPRPEPIRGIQVLDSGEILFIEGDQLKYIDQFGDINLASRLGFEEKSYSNPWAMEKNQSGKIAYLSSRKFNWIDPESKEHFEIQQEDFPDNEPYNVGLTNVTNIGYDSVLVCSDKIYLADLSNGSITKLNYDSNLNLDKLEIRDVIKDQNGYFWVILPSSVSKFKLTSNDSLSLIKSYAGSQGAEAAWANALHEDQKGRIWVFMWEGINCINPENDEVRYFGTKNGLPSEHVDAIQILETKDQRLAAGSSNGLIVFHPDSLWESGNQDQIPIVIKAIRIDGEEYSSELDANYIGSVELLASQNIIDFEVRGISFQDNARLEYSYLLEGLQDEWISIGRNNFISFQSLPPGDYNLKIKAGHPDQETQIKQIAINVKAPFYKKSWFIGLSTILLLTLLYLAYLWRIARVKSEEQRKTDMNKRISELELTALRAQMNPHFMFNSLNSIKNYILQAEPKIAAEYLSNFAHLIRMILQNSREKSISLQNELETLMLYIDLEKLRFSNEFKFNCKVDEDIDLELIKIPPMILQPYIENAIWHGLMHKKERGNLLLHFKKVGENIHCIIEDDGVGREHSMSLRSQYTKKYKSMGMGITKDRIDILNRMESLGIEVDIIDKRDSNDIGIGTKVIIIIPDQSF